MWPLLIIVGGIYGLYKLTSGASPAGSPGGGGGGGDATPGGGGGGGGGGGEVVDMGVPPVLDPYGVTNCITKEAEGFEHDLSSTTLRDSQWALVALKDLAAKAPSGATNIDGVCGDITRAAIERFQKRKGLWVTRYIDRATYLALRTEVPCAFQRRLLRVRYPLAIGRPDLQAQGYYVFTLNKQTSPGNETPYTTPIGDYEMLVKVSKSAVSGTKAAGSPCPFATVTEVVENKLSERFKYLAPNVGDMIRLSSLDTSGKWVDVDWPETV